MKLSPAAAHALTDLLGRTLSGGTLEIFSAPSRDGMAQAEPVLIASLRLPTFSTPVDGVSEVRDLETMAIARGTAGRFTASDKGGAAVLHGTIGTGNDDGNWPADLVLKNADDPGSLKIRKGDLILISAFTIGHDGQLFSERLSQ